MAGDRIIPFSIGFAGRPGFDTEKFVEDIRNSIELGLGCSTEQKLLCYFLLNAVTVSLTPDDSVN